MNPPALPLLADTAAVPVADRWQTQLQIGSIRAASTGRTRRRSVRKLPAGDRPRQPVVAPPAASSWRAAM
ncbi:hypothetical protein, partial [Bordetella pertussis]|uniref:hypothetical protein n=1 Tax=Bordetella pertussis TaxID=520 RepID=UPI0006DCD892